MLIVLDLYLTRCLFRLVGKTSSDAAGSASISQAVTVCVDATYELTFDSGKFSDDNEQINCPLTISIGKSTFPIPFRPLHSTRPALIINLPLTSTVSQAQTSRIPSRPADLITIVVWLAAEERPRPSGASRTRTRPVRRGLSTSSSRSSAPPRMGLLLRYWTTSRSRGSPWSRIDQLIWTGWRADTGAWGDTRNPQGLFLFRCFGSLSWGLWESLLS